ncbi:MAG: hypothetical protein AAB278_08555 [Pseudomonadota bacterium]
MKPSAVLSLIALSVLGLIIGYLVFGKLAGDYVSISRLLGANSSLLDSAFNSIAGIDAIRNKILLSGVAGAVLGFLIAFRMK